MYIKHVPSGRDHYITKKLSIKKNRQKIFFGTCRSKKQQKKREKVLLIRIFTLYDTGSNSLSDCGCK